MNDVDRSPQNWILIPFHTRWDLLEPLLYSLEAFSVLIVDDSNDVLVHRNIPKHVLVVKNKSRSSFANAVNTGLDYLCERGIRKALILNDDAKITIDDCEKLFAAWKSQKIISPIIIQNGKRFYGVKMSSWGRVRLLQKKEQPDALLGTCMLLPTELRFDAGFPHGFEDIELSCRAKQAGYVLQLLNTSTCDHIGEASLSRNHRKGQRFSTYGHLRLFSSKRKMPIIAALSLLQIVKEKGGRERYIGWAQGVWDWSISYSL